MNLFIICFFLLWIYLSQIFFILFSAQISVICGKHFSLNSLSPADFADMRRFFNQCVSFFLLRSYAGKPMNLFIICFFLLWIYLSQIFFILFSAQISVICGKHFSLNSLSPTDFTDMRKFFNHCVSFFLLCSYAGKSITHLLF